MPTPSNYPYQWLALQVVNRSPSKFTAISAKNKKIVTRKKRKAKQQQQRQMPTTFVAAVRVQTSILRNAKSWKFLRDVTQFTSPSHTDTQSHTNAHILVSERGACFFLHHDRYALFALHTFLRTHWRVVFHCVLFFVKLSLLFLYFFLFFFL